MLVEFIGDGYLLVYLCCMWWFYGLCCDYFVGELEWYFGGLLVVEVLFGGI